MVGYVKAAWALLVMLFLLPVWFARSVAARTRFRAELCRAGMPGEAARSLSRRYRIRIRDLRRFGNEANGF